MGSSCGCVYYPDEFMILNENKLFVVRLTTVWAGFMIAEVARLLHENKVKLPFGLYITNYVQEEVGLRSVEMITNHQVERGNHDNYSIYDNKKIKTSEMMSLSLQRLK
jgi:putative aminopeptidase FrvX